MPVRHLPDSVVSVVISLLNDYQKPGQHEDASLWVKKMITTACRHLEYFVEPLVSKRAAEIAKENNLGDLRSQRWRSRSKWPAGSDLYFEHARPAVDIFNALVALGANPDPGKVRDILMTAEVAWITVDEETRLPRSGRSDWRDCYCRANIELD